MPRWSTAIARRAATLILAALVVTACGPTARDKALRTAFSSVNVARAAFVEWDGLHQMTISDGCVDGGGTYEECQARLVAYRAARAPVVEAFTFAYRAIAAASIDSKTPLPTVLGIVADLGNAIEQLKGSP